MIALLDATLFALGYVALACYTFVVSSKPEWFLPITMTMVAALIAGVLIADCIHGLRGEDETTKS